MLEGPTAEESHAQLLQRIAARDAQALSEFYDQTVGPLFSVAVRILGDPAEAEEVIQDVFIQIWERAAVFDTTLGSAIHWALSITRHRSIDRLRARQRRARLLDELMTTNVAQDAPETGPARLERDEAAIVRTALDRLPPDQRQALLMAFFEGKTHLEIAQALGEPLGTIKARIRRSILKLRDSLQEYA
jgi:RNA polymerase sigma-70 factor (ECF subfamily)